MMISAGRLDKAIHHVVFLGVAFVILPEVTMCGTTQCSHDLHMQTSSTTARYTTTAAMYTQR